jgi:hypothetical protein
MSKQMDFQFTGARFSEMVDLVQDRVGRVPKAQLEEALTEKFPDEKERKLARATIIVLVKLYDTNRKIEDVRKVVVWRDKDGKPADIQIELTRKG